MKKTFPLLLACLCFAATSCEKEETNSDSVPTTVTITEDISHSITYSVEGTDGLNRNFTGTLSLSRPDFLYTNHKIVGIGAVSSLSAIEAIPQQGWDNQAQCKPGHGYVLRLSTNDAHSLNPGDGIMYVKVYVVDATVTQTGVVTSAKIQIENGRP